MGLLSFSKKKVTELVVGSPNNSHQQTYRPAVSIYPCEGAPPPYHPPPNVVVNNYYAAPPPGLPPASASSSASRLGSVVNLAADLLPVNVPRPFDGHGRPAVSGCILSQSLACPGTVLYDQIAAGLDRVMTSIDRDRFSHEFDLGFGSPDRPADTKMLETTASTSARLPSARLTGYLTKVDLYANARLPFDLPQMHLYLASYRLLSLAAKYADRAYVQPQSRAERRTYVEADWKAGTKAMVIKSVPMDEANTIVFAIRGTASFMDWTVNFKTAPTPPTGFLDDDGNLCHAGFLEAARRMVRPVAQRLRQLLEEDPRRTGCSLLITGHSAGGAVAALLYAHMLASSRAAESELTLLAGCFRRVHCITFGAPPVSLLPLHKPARRDTRSSMFYSFVNEGDPVVRADKAYVRSLLDLLASPAPIAGRPHNTSLGPRRPRSRRCGSRDPPPPKPIWSLPTATLSNAGHLVVLRSGNADAGVSGNTSVEDRLREGVVAQFTTDEQLRGVVWGDPVCHVMKLYAGRVEALAIAAMMGA